MHEPNLLAQSAGVVENTDWISAERYYSPNECPEYDIKQSDGIVSIMPEFWETQSTPLLSSLPGRLRPEVVALDRALSTGQTELNCLLLLNWIVFEWNVLTIKQRTYTELNYLK